MTSHLDPFFRPRSVALIGASRDPASISGVLLANLQASFAGPIYPINPRATTVGGLPAFPSLAQAPDPIDLAIVIVPAPQAIAAATDCVNKPVRAVVIITAGFAETGADGKDREIQLRQLFRSAAIPFLGPNCFGCLNTEPRSGLNATFMTQPARPGNVAVCTQSGALGLVFPLYLNRAHIGISQLVSIGNRAGIGENELLAAWREDPRTDVIQLYLESLEHPRAFLDLARAVSRRKPIVALKAGQTAAGQRAAGSHTAALATPALATRGLLRQAGAIETRTLEELFDTTSLLATQPPPRGRRVAILTNAGGPAVLCADELARQHLDLPELPAAIQDTLRSFVPAEASVRNPVDLVGSVDPPTFERCTRTLLESDALDALITLYIPRLADTSPAIARAVGNAARTARDPKTCVAVFLPPQEAVEELMSHRPPIPVFGYPEAAACALGHATRWNERRLRPPPPARPVSRWPLPTADAVRQTLLHQAPPAAGRWLTTAQTHRLLGDLHFRLPRAAFARSADETAAAARALEGTVVLKTTAPHALHKAAIGGVVTHLHTPAEAAEAYLRMTHAAQWPEVLVQEFIAEGIEILVGARRDSGFGHLIALGPGGTLAEALGPPALRLHPIAEDDAADMVEENAAVSRLLAGPSGPPADTPALRDLLLQLSDLLQLVPEIEELDFNPVRILPVGAGALVVDARIRLGPLSASPS